MNSLRNCLNLAILLMLISCSTIKDREQRDQHLMEYQFNEGCSGVLTRAKELLIHRGYSLDDPSEGDTSPSSFTTSWLNDGITRSRITVDTTETQQGHCLLEIQREEADVAENRRSAKRFRDFELEAELKR